MRLLTRTSKHHQPAHLAAAVAVGIVVGLVPKANLLAVGLYAVLLLLPLHTCLALAVSLVVAAAAGSFDPLTHALGSWLLRQQTLRPLWHFLDNTAYLPWLGLHNTVVLGSLVSGVTLAAPSYVIALRLFERMRWNASAVGSSQAQETIILAPQPIELATVRPPKFIDLPHSATMSKAEPTCESAVEEEEYEPVREVAAIINSWHMAHEATAHLQSRVLSAARAPVAHASSDQPAPSDGRNKPNNAAFESGFRPHSFVPPPRPWVAERPEIVDSLDLAHNASDVLDWVDGMLEECLSENSVQILTEETHRKSEAAHQSASAAQAAPLNADDTAEEQWLMETTIEVVRWGAGSPSPTSLPTLPTVAPTTSPAGQSEASSSVQPPVALTSTTDTPRRETSGRDAMQRNAGERNLVEPGQSGRLPFAQSSPQGQAAAGPAGQSQAADASEPQRGESLGFLLGHLRQEREGRS